MGIKIRAEKVKEDLKKTTKDEKEWEDLAEIIDCQMLRLTDDQFMGKSYKFMFVGSNFTFPFDQ
jgi:hypothetical protein